MAELGMGVGPVVSARVHVDYGRVELRDPVEELVPDVLGDAVALADGHVAIDGDRE
jgi:hypothetical protein